MPNQMKPKGTRGRTTNGKSIIVRYIMLTHLYMYEFKTQMYPVFIVLQKFMTTVDEFNYQQSQIWPIVITTYTHIRPQIWGDNFIFYRHKEMIQQFDKWM